MTSERDAIPTPPPPERAATATVFDDEGETVFLLRVPTSFVGWINNLGEATWDTDLHEPTAAAALCYFAQMVAVLDEINGRTCSINACTYTRWEDQCQR